MSKRPGFSAREIALWCCVTVVAHSSVVAARDLTSDGPAPPAGLNQGLEEIEVTADRRSMDVQKAALAISVIPADALQVDGVSQLSDVNGRIPGLEITNTSGYEVAVAIRGVGLGTPENELTTSPGVAMFIDGAYIANSISLDETLFDVDHLEVMRGPPGALYGQSSIGGAILLVTKQPALSEFSYADAITVGSYELHRERGEINIPLGERLAIRMSAQQYAHDGFTRDALLADNYLDDANEASWKMAVLYKPTDDFSATLTTQFYHSNRHGEAQKSINDPSADPYVVSQDYPARFVLDTNLTHLNLEWSLPWFTVKSTTAYQYLDHHQQEDGSRSAFALIGAYNDVAGWNTNLRNFNEEFDILSKGDTRLEWTTGVFLLHQETRQVVSEFECPNATQSVCSAPTSAQLTVTPTIESFPPENLVFGQDLQVAHESYAWFAQGTYHIFDDLRLTGGVRINDEGYSANTLAFGSSALHSSFWGFIPTWRTGIEYDVSPSNLIYVTTARGFKPGGINTSNTESGGAVLTPPTFRPETNTSFEVGSKNQFLGNSLRANFAAFYYIYRNLQYIATDPKEFAGGVENIPSTRVWGGEAELSYSGIAHRLHANLTLSIEDGRVVGSYYTIDSTIQQRLSITVPACMHGGAFYNPACFKAEEAAAVDIAGNKPAQMPNVLTSFNIAYDCTAGRGMLTPRLEYIYRGAFQQRIFNQPEVDSVPGYGLVNLNVEYVPTRNKSFSVQFSVTNLFGRAGVNSRYTDPYGTFTTSQQFIPPRQIMGTAIYSFRGS